MAVGDVSKPSAPATIRVAGKVYVLEPVERNDLGADRAGEANHRKLRITYDTAWAPCQQRDTVLHEVLHCCEAAAGIELQEQEVASIATLLYGVMRDNPELVKWLMR